MDMDVLQAMYFKVRGIYTISWELKSTGCAVYIRCALSMGKYGNHGTWCKHKEHDINPFV
jgi:hypothetical protein